ncbi:MAG: MFS transporter [bacterium]|nr:MFS transporter [bacterium]
MTARPCREARFDIAGAALFFVGLLTLLLALNKGHDWGWASLPICGLSVVAVVALGAFIAVERRVPEPMLDLALFRIPLFSGAVWTAMLTYVTIFAVLFLLPYYLAWRGHSPGTAGLLLMCQPLVMMATAPVAGTLSDRYGTRILVVAGLLFLAAGLGILSTLGAASPVRVAILGMVVVGFGVGLFVAPNNSQLLGAAPAHRRGIASGVLAASRNVGMVLGVGLAGAFYTTALANHGPDAVPVGISWTLRLMASLAFLAALVNWRLRQHPQAA